MKNLLELHKKKYNTSKSNQENEFSISKSSRSHHNSSSISDRCK